jgi:SAM-dependent methyltransferase
MTETCDLCQSSALEPIYEPTASMRGSTVYLCSDCGLVQSLPRADRTDGRALAVSTGADCRSVRYGKAFRSKACLSLIRAHADLDSSLRVLDVGSDRGSFARAMLAAASKALLTCVEPDKHMSDAYAGLARTELLGARIENTRLLDASFDIVHSCRALEQHVSPAGTLADHWRVLKPGGLLIVDVPNIALIDSDEIVEEWFIDEDLYHFSCVTLARLLEAGGFEIVARPDSEDRENLLFAARKRIGPTRSVARDPTEVDAALALITSYVTARARAQRAA